MSQQLQNINARIGNTVPVTDGDLIDNRTLTQHAFVPIYEKQGTSKRYYHVGAGVENNDTNVGRFSLDLQVADDDSGTNDAAAKGSARWAVYPDEPDESEPKATGDEFSLAKLRDWDALNHREKGLLAAKKPGAAKDEYVVLETKIDSSQEGQMVYAEGSSITGELSRVNIR